MNKFTDKINSLIGYKTDYLWEEINNLMLELEINPFNIFIEDIDTIFIKGFNFKIGYRELLRQLQAKNNDYLSVHYKVSGKQYTLKTFGKIDNLRNTKITKIVKLVTLIKLVKQISNLSYLASGVRFLDQTVNV